MRESLVRSAVPVKPAARPRLTDADRSLLSGAWVGRTEEAWAGAGRDQMYYPENRRRRRWCRLSFLLALSLFSVAPAGQSVFIINIDGLRSTEGFEAGRTNLPFIWDSLRPMGTLYTQFYNTGVTITNSAHSTIVTGMSQLLYNNTGIETPIRPDMPTIGEYYRKEKELPSDEAVFVTGKATTWCHPVSTTPGYGYAWAPTIVLSPDGDRATWDSLRSFVQRGHPSLCYAVFGQVDDAGHTGNWSYYISTIRQVDSLIFDVWRLLRSDPAYRDSTTLIITSDHGRHDAVHGGWWEHGCACHGCRHVGFLALGPGIKADTVITDRAYQTDIAPTVGRLLDFGTPFARGRVLSRMLRRLPRASGPTQTGPTLTEHNLSNSDGVSLGCDIALSPGVLHCVYADNSDGQWGVLYSRSTNCGSCWSDPEPLFEGSDDYTQPVLAAVDSSTLFAAALNRRWSDAETTCYWVLCARRSTNNGMTWQVAFDIESLGMVSVRPAVCASGSRVGVAVLKTGSLVFRLSTDRGVTFGQAETLSGIFPHYTKSPTVAMLGNQSFIAWQAIVPSFSPDSVNYHNIWLSSDQWGGGRRMLTRNGYSSYSYVPSLAAESPDVLHLAYSDLPDATMGNCWQVVYCRGTAHGDTWSSPVLLTSSAIGYAPAVCQYGVGRVATAWASFAGDEWNIAAAASADGGLTWSLPFDVSWPESYASTPRLVADNDTCFVVWEDNRDGNWEIYFTACPIPMSSLGGSASVTLSRPVAFPNPARGKAHVRYVLGHAGPVRIVLLDVAGRQVAELVNETQSAGVHFACLRAGRVPAGVYYCRLEGGAQPACFRLELLR
jgi:hypothetical protein